MSEIIRTDLISISSPVASCHKGLRFIIEEGNVAMGWQECRFSTCLNQPRDRDELRSPCSVT